MNQPPQRWLNGSIELVDSVCFFRPIELFAEDVPAEAASVTNPLPLGEESLAALQLLMRFPELIDVRNQDIPTDDRAFCAPHWQAPHHEPAVDAVGAEDTVFHVIRTPGFYRMDPPRHHRLAFIGM